MDLLLAPWHAFSDVIQWALANLADFTGSGGLAIIIFTLLVKTVMLPLTIKSVRSTIAMQELQPKIKELQKKYGKDRQRLSEETMRLYSEHGVNPVSGCLPMLAQMPIFFALYYAVKDLSQGGEGPFAGGFLWLQNLSEPDKWSLFGIVPIVPIAIMAAVFQFIQMRMSRPAGQGKVRDPQQAAMQSMMNFMPLMVIVFGWTFASGVVLYWATQSLYSVIQQWFITGWGSLKDWFPWLPELPEHRRLGAKKPSKDPQPEAAASGQPAEVGGLFGWMQRKTREFEQRQRERVELAEQEAAQEASSPEPEPIEEDEAPSDGVVTLNVQGGRARRKGRPGSVQGGSGRNGDDRKR